MNRFFRWAFGIKPTPGKYVFPPFPPKTITEEDIGKKYVRIRYLCSQADYLPYSTFHSLYVKYEDTAEYKFNNEK